MKKQFKLNQKKIEKKINILLYHGFKSFIKPFSRSSRRIFEFAKIHNIFGALVVSALFSVTLLPNSLVSLQTDYEKNNLTLKNTLIEEIKTESSIRLPIEKYHLTQTYFLLHPGIDLAAEIGEPIYSIMDGTVEKVSRDRFFYGNHLIVNHGSGLKSLYAHLSKIEVKEGQKITKNDEIGLVGSTGWSTGPHLHLQIWDENGLTNPKTFFEGYFGKKLASTLK